MFGIATALAGFPGPPKVAAFVAVGFPEAIAVNRLDAIGTRRRS